MPRCSKCGGMWYQASSTSPFEPCDCVAMGDDDAPATKEEAVDTGSSDDPRFMDLEGDVADVCLR